ncbi:MAG TPA: helix-turn-helix domain-containing protein, partial [Burkholderiaceae bacterium]|nr:helix-turn-helix domain-containing protein [Burkholderiaceae bacterium]
WLPINTPGMASAAAASAPTASITEAAPQAAPVQNGNTITVQVGTSIAEAERQLILATFAHCGHNKERTAAALGISLKTLYNRLKEFANDAREGETPTRTR